MNEQQIIQQMQVWGIDYLPFKEPIKVKPTPHAPTIVIKSIQSYQNEIRVYDSHGFTVWQYVEDIIKASVVQRLKLMILEKQKQVI